MSKNGWKVLFGITPLAGDKNLTKGLREGEKEISPETASVQEEHHPTVVSSADGAKLPQTSQTPKLPIMKKP